jgi:hypothetical protein
VLHGLTGVGVVETGKSVQAPATGDVRNGFDVEDENIHNSRVILRQPARAVARSIRMA